MIEFCVLRMILCYCMLCYVMLLSSLTRDEKTQKLGGFTITRQRTRQNWTEKICDDWMEHVSESEQASGPSYESYYYYTNRCRCRLSYHTHRLPYVHVCVRVYARAFVNVRLSAIWIFFSSCAAAAMKAKYEFLPTTCEMICCEYETNAM